MSTKPRQFADINGWKRSSASFAPTVLARGSTQRKMNEGWNAGWRHELFDHPVYYRETKAPYRPVAIVGQPYHTEVANAKAWASEIGLEAHAAPNLTASWHCPGATNFYCYTRPGVEVVFLPEQQESAVYAEYLRKRPWRTASETAAETRKRQRLAPYGKREAA